MSNREWSVVAKVQTVRNPVPFFADGGDCGPCALCTVLSWPADRIPEIYSEIETGKARGLTRTDMIQLLDKLEWAGVIEGYKDEPIQPRPDCWYPDIWGYVATTMESQWVNDLRLHLESGWLGITVIDFAGRGQWTISSRGDYHLTDGNHWVVLAGAKSVFVPLESGGGRYDNYIRVCCSSSRGRGDYWIEVGEFLRNHGGFRVIYVRPIPRPEVDIQCGVISYGLRRV